MTKKSKKSSSSTNQMGLALFDVIRIDAMSAKHSAGPKPGCLCNEAEFKTAMAEDITHAIDENGRELSRWEIVARMSMIMNKEITWHMLNNWTASSHENHMPELQELVAFVIATGGQRRAVSALSGRPAFSRCRAPRRWERRRMHRGDHQEFEAGEKGGRNAQKIDRKRRAFMNKKDAIDIAIRILRSATEEAQEKKGRTYNDEQIKDAVKEINLIVDLIAGMDVKIFEERMQSCYAYCPSATMPDWILIDILFRRLRASERGKVNDRHAQENESNASSERAAWIPIPVIERLREARRRDPDRTSEEHRAVPEEERRPQGPHGENR